MLNNALGFVIALLISMVNMGHSQTIANNSLYTLSGHQVVLGQESQNKRGVLLVFLNDECPICRFYMPEIERLNQYCKQNDLLMMGVFSGSYKKKPIKKFTKKYKFSGPVYLDPDFALAAAVQARVTPEVILMSVPEYKTLYQGKIDDSFVSLGVRNSNPSHFYLIDAIQSYLQGQIIKTPLTEALGCILNY